MGAQFIIDCGSRSIKLHEASEDAVTMLATRSWDPIGEARSADRIGGLLADLTSSLPPASAVHVVGTAAARRQEKLAEAIAAASAAFGWSYETLTQKAEALLIRSAFDSHRECDVVNVGGGSIQIVSCTGELVLLDFGVSDLNRHFLLDADPDRRQLRAARDYIAARLPQMPRPFIYCGGELSYLRALGAEVDDAGRCAASEFLRVAETVDRMTADDLALLSPFDAGWTSGAVASNAIVTACLACANAEFYYASDVNIADGVIRGLAGRAGRAAHTGA